MIGQKILFAIVLGASFTMGEFNSKNNSEASDNVISSEDHSTAAFEPELFLQTDNNEVHSNSTQEFFGTNKEIKKVITVEADEVCLSAKTGKQIKVLKEENIQLKMQIQSLKESIDHLKDHALIAFEENEKLKADCKAHVERNCNRHGLREIMADIVNIRENIMEHKNTLADMRLIAVNYTYIKSNRSYTAIDLAGLLNDMHHIRKFTTKLQKNADKSKAAAVKLEHQLVFYEKEITYLREYYEVDTKLFLNAIVEEFRELAELNRRIKTAVIYTKNKNRDTLQKKCKEIATEEKILNFKFIRGVLNDMQSLREYSLNIQEVGEYRGLMTTQTIVYQQNELGFLKAEAERLEKVINSHRLNELKMIDTISKGLVFHKDQRDDLVQIVRDLKLIQSMHAHVKNSFAVYNENHRHEIAAIHNSWEISNTTCLEIVAEQEHKIEELQYITNNFVCEVQDVKKEPCEVKDIKKEPCNDKDDAKCARNNKNLELGLQLTLHMKQT